MEICALDVCDFRPKIPLLQPSHLAAESGVFVWVDVIDNIAPEVRSIAEQFALHPLALGDALEPAQRPKLENTSIKRSRLECAFTGSVDLAEVDILVENGWIVTVRDRKETNGAWDPQRLRSGSTASRRSRCRSDTCSTRCSTTSSPENAAPPPAPTEIEHG